MRELEDSLFIYSDEELGYCFNSDHPFSPTRYEMTVDLLKKLNLLSDEQIVSSRPATDEEIMEVHDPEFVAMVKQANDSKVSQEELHRFGLDTADTPVFPNMHHHAAWLVGGTIKAADLVMSGKTRHAVHLAGGLHHAFYKKAAGFCVYNDAAAAIALLRKKYQARVMYLDTDAHHGDGVQSIFYDDPNVLTVSFHESGETLFPWTTGFAHETGRGAGEGFNINVPLVAGTEDDSFLKALHQVLPTIARSFEPDIIISQNGCDAHHWDPVANLSLTMRAYKEIPKLVHELAHELCDGRWVALGGGGYNFHVVPRAWSYLWSEIVGQEIDQIPIEWIEKWTGSKDSPYPKTFYDQEGIIPNNHHIDNINDKNKRTVNQILSYMYRRHFF